MVSVGVLSHLFKDVVYQLCVCHGFPFKFKFAIVKLFKECIFDAVGSIIHGFVTSVVGEFTYLEVNEGVEAVFICGVGEVSFVELELFGGSFEVGEINGEVY